MSAPEGPMLDRAEVRAVPGVPESTLPSAVFDALPQIVAPAPWPCRCDGVFWFGRPNRAAVQAIAPVVPGVPIAVIGGFVRYRETPVGAYDEVLGAVLLATRHGIRATVPFMAVDSSASVLGGRANWSLPKTLAEFTGAPERGRGMRAATADWSVSVDIAATRTAVPTGTVGWLSQEWPEGTALRSRLRARGKAAPALLDVRVDSRAGLLGRWLRPGRHAGAVLRDTSFGLGVSEPDFAG